MKISKYQDKHEEVIHAQGFFYNIRCKKFESELLSEPEIDQNIKNQCKPDPYTTPYHCLLYCYFMGFFVKNS
jgi:hypothetical protein